jgi:uncharacterized protein (TIGR01244 family)
MAEFSWITPDFAVAAQLAPDDLARAASAGIKTILKNRPEGEEPGQAPEAEFRAAARAAGLEFRSIPFTGNPPPGAVTAMATLLEEAPRPVLAYCRSGRRSILAWAMAQALAGARRPDEIIALGIEAGYDLTGARDALEALAPRT